MDLDITSLFSIGSKDTILYEIVTTVRSLLLACEARERYAGGWTLLALRVKEIITSQGAEVSSDLSRLSALAEQIRSAESELSDAGERAAEDLSDVVARYDVLFQVNETYLKAKGDFAIAAKALDASEQADRAEHDRPSYVKTKFLLQAKVQQAKENRRRVAIQFREAVNALIECREKYTAFKVRRLAHCWKSYGAGILKMVAIETPVFREIKEILGRWQAAGNVPQEAIAAVEGQIDAASEIPVITVSPAIPDALIVTAEPIAPVKPIITAEPFVPDDPFGD
jgi:hypothetical protein